MGPLQPTSTPNIPITASHLSSHPDLLRVFHKEGTDESHVEVQRAFKKGETLAKLEGLTKSVLLRGTEEGRLGGAQGEG